MNDLIGTLMFIGGGAWLLVVAVLNLRTGRR